MLQDPVPTTVDLLSVAIFEGLCLLYMLPPLGISTYLIFKLPLVKAFIEGANSLSVHVAFADVMGVFLPVTAIVCLAQL
jgi:hypothetical protein